MSDKCKIKIDDLVKICEDLYNKLLNDNLSEKEYIEQISFVLNCIEYIKNTEDSKIEENSNMINREELALISKLIKCEVYIKCIKKLALSNKVFMVK